MGIIALLTFPAPGHTHGILNLAKELQNAGKKVKIYIPLDGKKLLKTEEIPVQYFGQGTLPEGCLKKKAGKTLSSSGIYSFIHGISYIRLINQTAGQLELDSDTEILLYDSLYLRTPPNFRGKKVCFSSAINYFPDKHGKYPGLIANSPILTKLFLKTVNQLIQPKQSIANLLQPDLHFLMYSQDLISDTAPAANTHATGPWIDVAKIAPTQKKNFIYVSLGTLIDNERKEFLLQTIQRICERNKIQTIISWGAWSQNADHPLTSSEFVTTEARVDQMQLLREARLMITHGGINSVQECILTDTPMVVIPIKHDQDLVASRIKKLGLGQIVKVNKNFESNLEEVLLSELTKDRRQELSYHREKIIMAGGLKTTINIINQLLETRHEK